MARFERGGDPGPGRPKGSETDRRPRALRHVLEKFDQHPALLERAIRRGLKGPPRQAYPYVELIVRYRLGRPPESGEGTDRPILHMILTKGPPGGYDPLTDRRPPALPPGQIVEAEASPAPEPTPPRESLAQGRPPEDPDELVQV